MNVWGKPFSVLTSFSALADAHHAGVEYAFIHSSLGHKVVFSGDPFVWSKIYNNDVLKVDDSVL